MNTILVVDESQVFRKFVQSTLEFHGFTVHTARSGFDGLNQLRKHRPDLLIVDDGLNRQSINSLLQKKNEDVNIQDTPVIFTAREFSQDRIVELARNKIRRFLVKPMKIDQFLTTVASFFKNDIHIDRTPCQLNLHVNESLFLVEIAKGLNRTKLDVLPWKIREIMEVNEIDTPRIMVLMSDVHLDGESEYMLEILLKSLMELSGKWEDVKILTGDKYVKNAVQANPVLSDVHICESLVEAIDGFFGKRGLEKLTSNQDMVHKIYLSTDEALDTRGQLDLNFKEESVV